MQKIKGLSLWQKIMSVVIVLFIIGALIPTNAILVLAEDVVEMEYAKNLDIDFAKYIDEQESKNINLDKLEITDKDGNELSRYLEVGEYDIVICYKQEKQPLKLIIRDTRAPEIEVTQDIVVFENTKIDYEDYVTINEESEYNVEVDDSQVDYSKRGEYVAWMTVQDVHGNVSNKDIPVTINKLELTIKQKSITLKEKENQKIEVETNSKSQIIYTSSNDDIASVDTEGNITAKKAGKATITVSIEGKEEKCTIEVKSTQTVDNKKKTSEESTPKKNDSSNNKSDKNSSNKSKTNNNNSNKSNSDKNTSSQNDSSKKKSSSKENSYTVYITKTGAKYHRDGCQYLRQSKIAILKSNAISQGYTACSRCNP